MIQNDMALLAWQISWLAEDRYSIVRGYSPMQLLQPRVGASFLMVFLKVICRIAMNSPRSGTCSSSGLLSIEGERMLHRARQERERLALGPSVVSGQEIWGKWVAALTAWHVEVSVCLITG